jgi:prophage tail gpP-like protein
MADNDDDLSLKVGGQKLAGWTTVNVAAGIESCPRSFDVAMTERFPGEFADVVVKAGDACEVYIGSDRVITGYVDRYLPVIAARQHAIHITGRGKCEDLVDCSAEWKNSQIQSATVLSIAQKLANPYGIAVLALGDIGEPVPQFNIIWGETPYQVIERIARFRALLVYESSGGNLILSRAGSAAHATGIVEGQNVENATALSGMDQRYSEYIVRTLNISNADIDGVGDIVEIVANKGVPRHRRLYIIAEAGDTGDYSVAKIRGLWEAAARGGRSFNAQVTVDSWRDGAGLLWQPNNFVRLELPTLKLPAVNWVIGSVTFRRDAQGTHADILAMPKEAFLPEPFLLTPLFRDVDADQQNPISLPTNPLQ